MGAQRRRKDRQEYAYFFAPFAFPPCDPCGSVISPCLRG
ncbi:MAG: hypothetical protein AVDCRST_MAG56-8081 [uncultured Cytophagales bacterium]|uniref:Uncharacterized protein n=1 Tax=uncultured Cytophagales bacterium TaxID=158755 RepID=A0A6J4LYS5_9SPHI|nr:MAG: hypothetical protein AVDCRST_MAG56-8081 [uncultured Cytophagales bacterium]